MNKYFKQILRHYRIKYRRIFDLIRTIILYFNKPITVRNDGSKKVLICYISRPFRSNNHRAHSNQKEVIKMADVLARLGYSVDVVDYNSEFNIDYSPYNLMIGFGGAFARSFSAANFRGKRILHLTGANPNFSNEAEAKRAQSLSERRGMLISPRREVYWPWMFSAVNSDAMFVLGNEWTISTYNKLNKKTYLLPVPYVNPIWQGVINRNIVKSKHNFCWFSGSGAMHKGLDLVLDAIESMGSDFHLDVCGPIETERDFMQLYKRFFVDNRRVTFHGFIDVESESMRSILETNVFVIFPSCSEGGASSVITCMAGGLIPVVTKEASVEIRDFGFMIDSPDVLSVMDAIKMAVRSNTEDLMIRSSKAVAYAIETHSYERYEQALSDAISKAIH